MRHCKHSHWLSLSIRDQEINLEVSDRLQTLLRHLPDPDKQRPSLIVLIGNSAKGKALRQLVSVNQPKFNGRRSHGEIHLHVDAASTFGDRPILLADGDLPIRGRLKRSMPSEKCHETATTVLPRLRDSLPILKSLQEHVDNVYFSLLSPFTDVFCFFAVDLGGLRPIASCLAYWLDKGHPSTLPKVTRPQILIVIESNSSKTREESATLRILRQMIRSITRRDLSEQFAGVHILGLLSPNDVSDEARHRRLKESLLNASDQVRGARINSQTLFSATHFTAFFHYACSHITKTSRGPFDFIRASRTENAVAMDFDVHLSNFLRNFKTPEDLKRFAIPVVASSILLDNYPAGMHLFSPLDVFRVLYRDICYQVCRTGVLGHEGSTHILLPSGFVELLEVELSKLFYDFFQGNETSYASIHRQLLLEYKADWVSIRSDHTCFVCGRRIPQYSLPCGHCICENCVQDFGNISNIDPWLIRVDYCFLCKVATSGVAVKIKPKTATARVLSIDGGGVRGIVPLAFLQVLQDRIGLPHPVQDNFDIAYGTSSGGIIVLALFINGWSVDDCINSFEHMAKLAFRPRRRAFIPILSRMHELLVSFFANSLYPAHNLEVALQEVFGSERSILDCSHATEIGARIGLPVTTTQGTLPYIFTNYNGVGTRSQYHNYRILRPEGGLSQIPFARCTSAAPFFFKPKHISGLGTFQDGGIWYNNPLNVAVQEVEALYPTAPEPSLVVSLGTGASRAIGDIPQDLGLRDVEPNSFISWLLSLWRDGFISRILHIALLAMDPDKPWKEVLKCRHKAGNEKKGEYFRFTIEFDGQEPSLDDTSKMQELRACARTAISESSELDRLARCIIAEYFFFELDPTTVTNKRNESGQFLYTGYILCRLRTKTAAFEALLGQLIMTSAVFLLGTRPLPGLMEDRSSLDQDGNFKKRVSFEAPNRQSLISIHLKEGSSESCNISGSPFSINGLVDAQGLELSFGKPDHVKRKRIDNGDIQSRKRQRR